ncbi:MAG: metallophosphoesterase [Oscillospiraceae bacterium]|jgi:predicted MPP superfamily phosphohydrolase
MHIVLYLLAVIPLMLLGWRYLYSYFLRMLEYFGRGLRVRTRQRLALVLSGVITLPAAYIWGLWAVILLYVVCFALMMDLANVLVQKRSARAHPRWAALWRSGLVPLLCAALLLSYGCWNMRQIRETDYIIYTQKDIRPEGWRVALLSDLHFGTTMDEEKLAAVCARVSEAKPDMVVLAGDIVDEHTTKSEMLAAAQVLGSIESRCGTYYVFGNHDKNNYTSKKAYSGDELRAALTAEGIRVMEDESVRFAGELTLVGRRDRSEKDRQSAAALLKGVDRRDLLILADHQPKDLKDSRDAGYDLELSGHTHGGQVWPCGRVADLFNPAHVSYGHVTDGDWQLIVTSGLAGWGYAVRTEHSSEYVIVNIEKAA